MFGRSFSSVICIPFPVLDRPENHVLAKAGLKNSQSGTALDRIPLSRKQQVKRVRISLTVLVAAFVVCAIALALLFLPAFITERSAVPFQYKKVWIEDDGGVATIRSDAFRVAFEGQSFGSRRRSGDYVVDGRYGFRLFTGPESGGGDVGGGVAYDYSQRRRLLTFRYRGHEIAYSNALNKLTIDGWDYSTVEGQVRILIKGNGEVERVGK